MPLNVKDGDLHRDWQLLVDGDIAVRKASSPQARSRAGGIFDARPGARSACVDRGTRAGGERSGSLGSGAAAGGAAPGGAPGCGGRWAATRGWLQSVSHTSNTGCSTALRPGLSANIQPEKMRFSLPSSCISSTSTKVVVLGGSVGARVKHTRGVTLRAPKVAVWLSGTSRREILAVTLSRAAKTATVFSMRCAAAGAAEPAGRARRPQGRLPRATPCCRAMRSVRHACRDAIA